MQAPKCTEGDLYRGSAVYQPVAGHNMPEKAMPINLIVMDKSPGGRCLWALLF